MRLEGTSLGKVALFGWCCKMGLKRMSKGKSVVYRITIHAPYVELYMTETPIHIFRDCSMVKEVWARLSSSYHIDLVAFSPLICLVKASITKGPCACLQNNLWYYYLENLIG